MKCLNTALPLALAATLIVSPVSTQCQGITSVPGTDALTLDVAIRWALAGNPELRASVARMDAASGRAYQAKQWSNPELEWSAEDWPVSGGQGFSDAKQLIGIAQTLPFPAKKSLDKQIGNAGLELSETELTLRRIEVVRDVKTSFYRVLACKQLLAVARQLLAVAESSAATAQKRVEAGAAAYQEQLRAEVQLEQARTELMGYERELITARQALATLLGWPNMNNADLTGALADTPDPRLLDYPSEEPLGTHPMLNTAQANLHRARLESRRARLEPYPDVKVGVAGGRIGATDESIIQLGFSLPLPIFDRGKGKQQEAQANVNVAEAEMLAVQKQLQRERANARQRYRTAVEQVANYRERILPKATEALHLVQTGFEQGKFNFIDLVDTQRMSAEARLVYQQKLLEMNLAQVELEALLQPHTSLSSTPQQ